MSEIDAAAAILADRRLTLGQLVNVAGKSKVAATRRLAEKITADGERLYERLRVEIETAKARDVALQEVRDAEEALRMARERVRALSKPTAPASPVAPCLVVFKKAATPPPEPKRIGRPPEDDTPLELEDGRWVTRNGIKVWETS